MKSITLSATVNRDRKAVIDFPSDIQPGVYTLRVYFEEYPKLDIENPLQGLPCVSAWDRMKDVSLRREDMYGDEGR